MAKILLAEDDSSMRLFLTTALRNAGHSVKACPNGIAALEIIEQSCDYELLLTDIVMPGMDGIELSQKASDMCPDLRVMFITGFAAVAMGQQTIEQNNAKVFSKPFHLRDLVDQVNSLLAA